MKKLAILFTLIALAVQAQDEPRRFELGSTLLTVNSLSTRYYFPPHRPAFEFVNGVFFRYHKKRSAFRALLSYSDNSTNYTPPPNWADAISGSISNKDFRIGAGVQRALLKNKNWLYALADLSYRNVYSSGAYSGGIAGANNTFWRTGNGVDALLGIGFLIHPLPNLCFSPELGYFITHTVNDRTEESLNTGHRWSYRYSETKLHPQLKLHLSARF